jgi:hypothetical protein
MEEKCLQSILSTRPLDADPSPHHVVLKQKILFPFIHEQGTLTHSSIPLSKFQPSRDPSTDCNSLDTSITLQLYYSSAFQVSPSLHPISVLRAPCLHAIMLQFLEQLNTSPPLSYETFRNPTCSFTTTCLAISFHSLTVENARV